MKPKEIHELGLREVKRIRVEMDKLIAEVNFNGSFEEFTKFLRTDPQFYYSKPDVRFYATLQQTGLLDDY